MVSAMIISSQFSDDQFCGLSDETCCTDIYTDTIFHHLISLLLLSSLLAFLVGRRLAIVLVKDLRRLKHISSNEFYSLYLSLLKSFTDGVKHFLTKEEQEIFANVAQNVIPQELLDTLVQMQKIDYKHGDYQRHITLAETFPATVYTFGPKNWLYIKAIYMSFCVHENPAVRQRMAESIHQVARIIGPKQTEKDLCKVFQRFAKDTNEIQQTLLKNLYAFIKAMPKESRTIIAADLPVFNTCDVNNQWRLRYEFTQQLTRLVSLFRPYEINTYLVPFALTFTADKISEIRLCALDMVASILAVFIKHEHSACKRSGLSISSPNSMPLSEKFLDEIQKAFWKSKNWRRRQSFAVMMKIMLEKELISRKKFCHIFRTNIIELSVEEIPNIRQYFCTISELIGRDRLEELDPELHSLVLSRLHHLAAADHDLEVQMMARVVLGTMDKLKNEVDLSCRAVQSEFTEI